MSQELEARTARETEERILGRVRSMRAGWVELAGDLYQFSEQRMWKALSYNSFEEWLASPEIELSRRTVFALTETWRELVVQRGVKPDQLKPLDQSKVRDLMPAIRRGRVEIERALADAESLSRRDLRERYVGGTMANVDDPPLAAETEPEWEQCENCDGRGRIMVRR